MLIDTHCHLDAPAFDADREQVIDRARESEVNTIVTIGAGYGANSAQSAIQLADRYDFIYATVGIHPHEAGKEIDFYKIAELAAHKKVVAIGETGLDFFKEWAPVDMQIECFCRQVELAKSLNKPLIIHSREASQECLRILTENKASLVGGVFHCYEGDFAFSKQLRKLNFKVSFGGILTFKKANRAQEAAAKIDLSDILLETDSPYLAPVPNRGKRCEPSYIVHTARALADLRQIDFEQVCEVTTQNALSFFKIGA
jgi:TatD DNase family protein